MKKLFIIFASMFFMFACTQEKDSLLSENEKATAQIPELTTAEAQMKFAKLLSQAASNSVEVRKFLKNEATKQFDNDYDVFYPMVKNKIVTDGKSFKDILLSYCKTPNELTEIEQSQLLLNILIPDLTLFWDFNAKKWDVNDKEVVVLCRDDERDTMYENGENIGQMTKGDVPGFPCLVIKNNERLKVKNINTRSGEATYEFISDAFNGSKRIERPTTRHSEYDIAVDTEENLDAYIPQKEIPDICIKAYEEFKNVPNAYQRDNIYYNINKSNNPGYLDRNIRDRIYRFRINANAYSKIAEQDKDPKLQNHTEHKRKLTVDEIRKKIWTDGAFEFKFKTYIAGETAKEAMEVSKSFTVKSTEAFSIKKVHLRHKNSTMFRESKNFYSFYLDDLRSKWIYPEKLEQKSEENYVFTEPWDLYGKSLTIFLFIEEVDDSQTITEKKTVVSEFTNKADFSLTGGGKVDEIELTAKLGYGFSHTKTVSNEVSITTNVGSDDLGSVSFQYYNPIIRDRNSIGDCKLFNASTGDVSVTLLPIDTSK